MQRRPGMTLVEVLVAIFVAGIGMLGLLVLFPLGALSMAQAIRDDRAGQAAQQAAAFTDALGYRTDSNVTAQLSLGNPVYIDAVAVKVMSKSNVVGVLSPSTQVTPSPGIARVAPTGTTTAQLALLRFSLLDDLGYTSKGAADTTSAFVDRGGRYSWAYMARQPSTLYPGFSDLAVVVYDGRNRQLGGGESYYTPLAASTGAESLTLTYSGAPPPLRRGSWILDASAKGANDPPDLGNLHAFFYRVVDAYDNGSSVTLDLQTPLAADVTATGTIVVLENVIDVFERRTGQGK